MTENTAKWPVWLSATQCFLLIRLSKPTNLTAPTRGFTTRKIDGVAEEAQASCYAAISYFKAVFTTFQNTSKNTAVLANM